MDDTTLLKHILGHLSVTDKGDLDWPYSDMVEGLKDAGEDAEVVDALIKRRSEFYPKYPDRT
jgi:hypothetical protein